MIRIWGRLNSVNVQKVVFAAREAGVAFERIEAGGPFGIVKTPEYQAKNPNGLIPLLEDGDFVLWESNAIVRYLCAKYAHATLYPEPLAARADADRWMDWQATTLQPAMGPAFMQLIRAPAAERNTAAIEESARKTEPLMAVLDAQLAAGRPRIRLRRAVHDGRHRAGLRRASLVRPAAGTHGTAERRALVRRADAAAGSRWRADAAARMSRSRLA